MIDKISKVKQTRGQLEALISDAIIKFEKEHIGRGPNEVKSFIIGDLILVRLKGVLTPAEQQLVKNEEGRKLIKQVRENLIENSKSILAALVKDITGRRMVSLHTDISTKMGERIIVFVLDKPLDD